jgi:ketosteroid isomerase-like protein
MSEANAEVVKRFLDALDRRNFDDAVACLQRDAEWGNTAAFPGPRTIRGAEAVIEFWKTLVESFDQENHGMEIEDLRTRGDLVIAALHSWGRGAGSSIPVDVHWALRFALRDRRIVRADVSGEFQKALEAAGLSE